jgi:hypothetical protein
MPTKRMAACSHRTAMRRSSASFAAASIGPSSSTTPSCVMRQRIVVDGGSDSPAACSTASTKARSVSLTAIAV